VRTLLAFVCMIVALVVAGVAGAAGGSTPRPQVLCGSGSCSGGGGPPNSQCVQAIWFRAGTFDGHWWECTPNGWVFLY